MIEILLYLTTQRLKLPEFGSLKKSSYSLGSLNLAIEKTTFIHSFILVHCKLKLLIIPKKGYKMTEAKRLRLSVIQDILPPEMVEKILKLLHIKDLCQAQLICRRWKEIIDKGNLIKKASGKDS